MNKKIPADVRRYLRPWEPLYAGPCANPSPGKGYGASGPVIVPVGPPSARRGDGTRVNVERIRRKVSA